MGAIFQAQFRQTIRAPWSFLIMIVMTVIMAVATGYQATSTIVVPVIAQTDMTEDQANSWLALLNESTSFDFRLADDESAVLRRMESSGSGVMVRLGQDSWTLLTAPNDESSQAVAVWVSSVYRDELTMRTAADGGAVDQLRAEVAARMSQPAMSVAVTEVASVQGFTYDRRTHGAFGMGLFFVMFTLLFGVNMILEERRTGLWSRVIVSSVPKLSMFGGHFTFTFLTGMVQLLVVFGVFRLFFGVDTGPYWPLALLVAATFCLAITALGMLLAGLVGNAQQMNVVIPIVAVSSAMIGGAYWPIEIVSNRILLGLSQVLPLRHAMDALKGLAYNAWGFSQVAPHVLYMAGFAVVCTVVGVWLIDRRR